MNNTPQNPEAEPARREPYGADYSPGGGAATQRVDPSPTTYIPPELRPVPDAPQPQYTPPQYAAPQPQSQAHPLPPVAQPMYVQPVVRERQRFGTPIVGPVILIGAGVLLLLNTLDIVSWSVWDQLWRLWPLILVAVGLDILIGRRSALLSFLIVLLLIGGGAAVVLFNGGFTPSGNLASTELNVPSAGAQTAGVNIKFAAGELNVDGAAGRESLATGKLEYYENNDKPTQEVTTNGDAATLTLRQHGDNFSAGFFFGGRRAPRWDVHLNPAVPASLVVDLGAGNTTLDLSALTLTHLNVSCGAGNTTITVPKSPSGTLGANISGGVGNVHVRVPEGVAARVKVSSGIGNVSFDSGFTKDGNTYTTEGYSGASSKVEIELSQGVGNLEISR